MKLHDGNIGKANNFTQFEEHILKMLLYYISSKYLKLCAGILIELIHFFEVFLQEGE